MTAAREFRAFEVGRTRHTERISVASRSDFVFGASNLVARDQQATRRAMPYCLDVMHRRSLYVVDSDPVAVQQAGFYYLHLRRTARWVLSVPWEHGALSGAEGEPPILVFSPGRVGSTLLSAMLFEAGIANVSEPDFYTQVTTTFAASAFNFARRAMAVAAQNMGRDLGAALGVEGPVVAKLRAECCRAPWLALDQACRPRAIFMTRSFEPWARSTGRVFRAGPRRAVAKYLQSLECYAWLKVNSDCHLVLYDRLIDDPASVCTALGQFLGRPIPPEAARRALARDSQEATPLRQGARPDLPGSETTLADTLALWRSDAMRRRRAALPLYEEN